MTCQLRAAQTLLWRAVLLPLECRADNITLAGPALVIVFGSLLLTTVYLMLARTWEPPRFNAGLSKPEVEQRRRDRTKHEPGLASQYMYNGRGKQCIPARHLPFRLPRPPITVDHLLAEGTVSCRARRRRRPAGPGRGLCVAGPAVQGRTSLIIQNPRTPGTPEAKKLPPAAPPRPPAMPKTRTSTTTTAGIS